MRAGKFYSTAVLMLIITLWILGNSKAAHAAAFPRPAPRESWESQLPQGERQNISDTTDASDSSGKSFDSKKLLEDLRRQYPSIPISADASEIEWITAPSPSGKEAEITAGYEDELYDEEGYYEASQLEQEFGDAQLAQHWLDVKEDLLLRDIDNKALKLVREFASAKNAIPPLQGMNGAVSYTFGSYIPKIVCRPNRVTDIALQPGEKVTGVHAGDTVRWQINPAVSGSGGEETIHVIIKPLVPDISTNLLVMTDRRSYNLDLVSSNSEFIPSARFTYPDDTLQGWNSFIAEAHAKKQNELLLSEGTRITPDDLFFGYEIVRGKEVPWKPLRVFDDGVKTYIEMPDRYKSIEAPVLLFYEGRQQKLVNYRVKERFYVVDRIMTRRAVLIAGQTRVIIERKTPKDA